MRPSAHPSVISARLLCPMAASACASNVNTRISSFLCESRQRAHRYNRHNRTDGLRCSGREFPGAPYHCGRSHAIPARNARAAIVDWMNAERNPETVISETFRRSKGPGFFFVWSMATLKSRGAGRVLDCPVHCTAAALRTTVDGLRNADFARPCGRASRSRHHYQLSDSHIRVRRRSLPWSKQSSFCLWAF